MHHIFPFAFNSPSFQSCSDDSSVRILNIRRWLVLSVWNFAPIHQLDVELKFILNIKINELMK